MKRIFHILILLIITTLTACTQSNNDKYNAIIDKANRIEINYKDSDKTVVLTLGQVKNLKAILKRNIKPDFQRKFVADIQVDIYENDSRIGFLMITDNDPKPFVNFGSDSLSFGFQLTYGLGMYLNENK